MDGKSYPEFMVIRDNLGKLNTEIMHDERLDNPFSYRLHTSRLRHHCLHPCNPTASKRKRLLGTLKRHIEGFVVAAYAIIVFRRVLLWPSNKAAY
jgi:hypothetical protein